MSMKKVARKYVRLEQTPSDVDNSYSVLASGLCGGLHIFFALFSVALGAAAICIRPSGFHLATGVWCGFVFLVAGVTSLASGCVRNVCMITANMVFNLVAIFAAVVQFSLGIVAAAGDSPHVTDIYKDPERYDIYESRIHDRKLCAGADSFGWKSWLPVDILLVIVAGLECFIAIVMSIYCCRAVCCGRAIVLPVQHIETGPPGLHGNGYSNYGYDTGRR